MTEDPTDLHVQELEREDARIQAEIERRVQERMAVVIAGMPEALERAVERGIAKALDDPERQARYWARGYEELEKHAGMNAAQWLGRRLWNIVITAAIAAMLAWVAMTGRGK